MKTIERTAVAILVIAAGLALAVAFPAAANATGDKTPPAPQPAPQSQKQDQDQVQAQGQTQAQAQQSEAEATAAAAALARAQSGSTADAISDASNGGQSLSYTNIQRDRLQAPNVYAPTVAPSAVCGTGWSVGLSGPGAAVAGGRSKVDPACEAREEARLELERQRYAMSYLVHLNPALALRVLCQQTAIAQAVRDPKDCELPAPVVEKETARPAGGSSTLTEERVREMIDRAFRASQAK